MRSISTVSRPGPIAVLAAGLLLVVAVPGAASPGVARASGLTAATEMRERAEARLAELEARHAELGARLADAAGEAQAIADEIVATRRRLRVHAVQMYVAGGVDLDMLAVLDAQELSDVVDRRSMAGAGVLDASAEVARYHQLQADHDPAIVRLAAELDRSQREVADATDALFQARAVEADAERQEQARRDAEERARIEQEAAARQQAAAVRAAAATPAAVPSGPATNVSGTTPAPAARRGPRVVTGGAEQPSGPLPDPPAVTPPEEAWAALRTCESGGNYRIVSASGRYRGAYQFDVRTWEGMGGTGDPAMASPAEQDVRAKLLYAQRGARAWPVCGARLRG